MMQNYISPLALISSLNNSIVLNFSVLKRITFGFLLFCCWQTFSHTTKSIFSENKVSIEVGHSPSAVVTPTTGPTHDKYVVGYFAQWAIYTRDFNVSDIEAEHLTHLMYAFYDVKFEDDDSGTVSLTTLDPWADFGHTEDPGVLYGSNPKGNFGALKELKMENPHLNILMSIGGWTRSIDIPAIANDPVKTDMLVQQMVNLMKRFPFIDGFDVDWEFPITGGISAEESRFGQQPHYDNDHTNLVLLLKAMREGFDEAFPDNRKWVTMAGGNNVGNLLSTHVGPGTESLHGATENLADYADFITFFGYDFGGNWFEKTSYNAPLYPSYNPEDPLIRRRAEVGPEAYDETQLIDKNRDGIDDLYDAINEAKGISTDKVPQQALDDLITLYLDYLEIPKEKLIMGVPFYGRLFDNVAHGEVETGLPGLFRYAPRRTGVRCTNGLDDFGSSSPQGSWDDPNDRTFFGGECGFSGSIGFSDLSQGVASNPHHLLDINDFSKLSAAAIEAGWVRHWDDTAKVPYLYNENTQQFISYDDEESINIKVNYALQRDLGGVMIWELSEDSRHELDRDATTRVPKYTFDNGAALLNQIEESLNSIQVTLTLNFEDQTGAPIEGVLVELTNRNGTPITSLTATASGQAVFPNLEGYRDYNFSYTKEDFAFLPPNKALAAQLVSSDKSFTIVGSNNLIAFEGTTTLEGTAGSANVQLLNAQDEVVLETQSGSDGSFRLENVVGGLDYSVTATQEFYTFNSLNYTAPTTDILDIDLTGTRDRYTLSGRILDAEGGTVSQVTVYLTGDATADQTTDDTGVFRFENLEAGRDYTLTPQHDELSFLPQTKNYNTLRQDQSVDFVLNNGYFFGTAKDGTTPIEGVTVQLTFNYVNTALGYATHDAQTNADGEYTLEDNFVYNGMNLKISDYVAAGGVGNLRVLPWASNGFTFLPLQYDFAAGEIPTSPTQFDFNTQQPAPSISITAPTQNLITLPPTGSVTLTAEIEILPADEAVTLSRVVFSVDGTSLTASQSGNTYTALWTPTEADFSVPHSFRVEAETSNGEQEEESFSFELECSGAGCPNVLPEIVLNSPTNLTVNQSGGHQPIIFEIAATDSDGTVEEVTISIGGSAAETLTVSNGLYFYSFTPSAYSEYQIVITATDNSADTTMYRGTLNIIDSNFTPLPDGPIIVGYAQSWHTSDTPFLTFSEIAEQSDYNLVVYAFIIPTENSEHIPQLAVYQPGYQTGGTFDKQKLIDDIAVLKDKGVPVIVSVGGATGHFRFNTATEKDEFVAGIKEIVDEYGFDGLDIDFEGASMNFGASGLTDFSYEATAAYPRLRNTIDAFKELKAHYGNGFIMTCAPETPYVQGGFNAYSDTVGSFLPVIDNLRDELDLIMVQLYNLGTQGSVFGLDRQLYGHSSGVNFVTAMTDMLMQGFRVANNVQFDPIPASKLIVALPACPGGGGTGAAPAGGYITPENTIKGLDYLRFGTDFEGRTYTLFGDPQPNLRGMMTWSINWDAVSTCGTVYEFIDSYKEYFFDAISLPQVKITQLTSGVVTSTFTGSVSLTVEVILSPMDGTATVSEVLFDVVGQQLNALPIGDNQYQVSWNPNDEDYGMRHTIEVNALATNNQTADLEFEIELQCVGNDCPNALPVLTFLQPDPPVVPQSAGFEAINIQVEATDPDGSIAQVELEIDGNTAVPLNATTVSNVYEYDFTPAAFGDYNLRFIATDDRSATQSLTLTLTVSNTSPPDEDNDGVPDEEDRCPNTPADEIELVNEEGCAPSQLATGTLAELITPEEWETLFPYRNGFIDPFTDRTSDFYSYQNFANAINRISAFELLIERRCGRNSQRITHINRATGVETLLSTSPDFDASWVAHLPIIKESVRYSDFLAEGDLTKRKRELAAFLANISHETTGGPEEGNTYEWGLFFKIEGGGNSTPGPYVVPHDDYPAVEGQSYYGRGPLQLSYNFNYGQASEHIFGDKNKLLENPELLETDAEISFMTAIWFWMTPQAPKPSAHDVILDLYEPSQEEIDMNRVNGFGTTVNIINGGLECGLEDTSEGEQVVDRINYYKRYTDVFEVSTDLDGTDDCSECGCAASADYNDLTFTENCDGELPSILILTPEDGTVTQTLDLAPITITTSVTTVSLTLSNFNVVVDGVPYYDENFEWQPRFYKSHTITATGDIDRITYYDSATITLYDSTDAIDCSGIPPYVPTSVASITYDGGSIVRFNGKIYYAQYYANTSPDTDAAWVEMGSCLTGNTPPEVGLSSSTLDEVIYTVTATVSDSQGIFFIEFYQDGRLMKTVNPRTTVSELISTTTASYDVITTSSSAHPVEVKAYDKHGAVNIQTLNVQRPVNSCGIPQWYNDVEYLFPGGSAPPAYVEYNGNIYRNTGYVGLGTGNEPGVHANWTLVTTSCTDLVNLPLADNCDVANLWDPTIENYNTNDLVMYNGGLYRVKYYIAGNVVPDRYTAYDFVGVCVSPPELSSPLKGETTWIMSSTIESITVSATVNSFGFDPTTVEVGIRPFDSTSVTTYTLSSSDSIFYSSDWTPAAYGIYELVITATNSAGQQVAVSGNANVVRSLPPVVTLLNPEDQSAFVQESFTSVPISFTVDRQGSAVTTVTVEDLTAATTTQLDLEASATYSWNWTPTQYGTNNLLIRAINTSGDEGVLPISFQVDDPTMETLVLSDPDLFQIVATTTITKTFTFDETITGLKMRDPSTASVTISGNQLIVSNAVVGRSGLEIITSSGSYFIGLRIDHLDGTVAGLPDHVAVGSVSEDVPNDLAFWEDIDNDNLLKNKRVDTRYIYINGGAVGGWPIDNPTRVVNYVKNSLRYGLIPTFIYYQIPDRNESYYLNDISIRNPEYMKLYFENINLFLDDVKKFIGDELFVVILEPDFLGYLQQAEETKDRVTAVGENEIAENAGTLETLVNRINKEFDTRRTLDQLNMQYGWQLNLWAKPNAAGHFGIIRETDGVTGSISSTLQEIRNVAEAIGQYGIDAGILTSNADFISIDKYGLDAIGGPHPEVTDPDPLTQPEEFTWFWNNDHWLNYLDFVDALRDLTQKHVILWQVPVGHINESQTISEYTGSRFTDLSNTTTKYEDSATTFFFGDQVQLESDERWDYFTQNKHNDPKLVIDDVADRKLTFGSHMEETLAAGVRIMLMGAGVGASTDGVGDPPTDDYFWIQKVQEYYQDDLVDLPDADGDGVNDFDDLCPDTPLGEEVDVNGCSESQLDDDKDGVKNNVDQCPFTPEGEEVDTDGCSESQKDDDNDGVNNAEDNCPITPNPDQDDANQNGIGDVCEVCEELEIPVPELQTITATCTVQLETPSTEVCSDTLIGTTSDTTYFTEEGTYYVVWKFTASTGKSVTATQTVILDDTEEPAIPILGTISGTCSVTVPIPTTLDSCTGLVTGTTTDELTYTKAGVYTVTWAFNDGNGNTRGVQQKVRVIDEEAPIAPTLEPITGSCSLTVTQIPVAEDNCAGTLSGTTSDSLEFTSLGEYSITWRFDDGNGNFSTATQSVTIEDTQAPIPPTLSPISESCSLVVTEYPTAEDACTGTVTATTTSTLEFDSIGEYSILWRFDDGNGNISTATQSVSIVDAEGLLIPELEPLVGECAVTVTEIPVAQNTCGGTVTGTTTDLLSYDSVGNYTITWTFDNGFGTVTTTTQTVTVQDTQSPVVPTLTERIGNCSLTVTEYPTAEDACTGTVTATTTSTLEFNSIGEYSILWRFDDGNGNISTATQSVSITDTTAPTVSPTLTELQQDCSLTISPSEYPTAEDNCSGTITGTTSDSLEFTTPGNYSISWRFDDGNGNISTATQSVSITDTAAPLAPSLGTASGTCEVILPVPTASDNCAGQVSGTTEQTVFSTPGTYEVTWIFEDANNNSSSATQTVIVRDNQAPVPGALGTVSATCEITLDTPYATDSCAGRIPGTTSQRTFSTKGSYLVTWVFDDGNGNTSTATQTVIITDNEAPVISESFESIVRVSCSFDLTPPTAEDSCTGTVIGTTSDTTSFRDSGRYQVYWVFDDGQGNSTSVTQTVIVDERIPETTTNITPIVAECGATVPVAVINNTCDGSEITGTTSDSLIYNTPGVYIIRWSFPNSGGTSRTLTQEVTIRDTQAPTAPSLAPITQPCSATVPVAVAIDNCSGRITGQTSDPLTYETQGVYNITWTFTDQQGNTSTANQSVVVNDTEPPVAVVLENIQINCGDSVPTPTTTDNCAGVVAGTTTFPENFHLTGVYDIIWTFSDNNGNSVASTQSIEVVDNTPPDVPTLEPVEVSCGESVSSPSLIDSCSNEEIVARTDDPTSFAREGNYTIRWIFTDANGNQATTTQEVEVAPFDDLILPELPLLSDSCTIIVPRPIATDGCSGAEVLGETEDTLVYTEIGEYTVNWVFTDRFGKETRATQRVQLNADREVDDEIEACDSYTWIDGVTYTEDNNTARFIEEDAEGCEIIHYLKLTINKVDPTIMRIDNTLIANQEGARYQWIDCDNDNQPIVGETNREFTPSRKGSYAVRVTTVDECTEISECYAFDIEVSIAEGDITIFPVPPTEGIINIVMSEPLTFTKVELLSIDNKLILEETFSSPVSSASISMPSLATGVYFVRLITPDGTLYIKQILIP